MYDIFKSHIFIFTIFCSTQSKLGELHEHPQEPTSVFCLLIGALNGIKFSQRWWQC